MIKKNSKLVKGIMGALLGAAIVGGSALGTVAQAADGSQATFSREGERYDVRRGMYEQEGGSDTQVRRGMYQDHEPRERL